MELNEWRVDSTEIGLEKIPQNGWELNPWYQSNQALTYLAATFGLAEACRLT